MSGTAIAAPRIKSIVYKKPSIVIRAAIHGLQTYRNNDDFIIDMMSYGGFAPDYEANKTVCMGCLATCALQTITNVRLTPDSISEPAQRAKATGQPYGDVAMFEGAVNDLRWDETYAVYSFCQLSSEEKDSLPFSFGIGRALRVPRPTSDQLDFAIFKLTAFAELLEAKGF